MSSYPELLSDPGTATMDATNRVPSMRAEATGLSLSIASDIPSRTTMGVGGIARRTMGIALLLVTVFLWTLCNFLASTIFADQTYDKPFFLVYLNTSVFAISLLPEFIKYLARSGIRGLRSDLVRAWPFSTQGQSAPRSVAAEEQEGLMVGENLLDGVEDAVPDPDAKLTFRQTVRLSLEFCLLWFTANYLSSACLEYTSVASTTILGSTSGIWTLFFGALFGTEAFTMRKLIGVLSSVTGVVLISMVDLSGSSDDNRGSFPHKTPGEIALGDCMALASALVYGTYITLMKRRVGSEDRVNMKLFFGLVGFINLILLWPLFFILHWTEIEPFELPPTGKIWAILLVNSLASFISDFSWALAMLLTTPLVVTVGLSLTIPLSLVGEMFQYGQHSGVLYWLGAAVVVLSFLFINHESHEPGSLKKSDDIEEEVAAMP
ncbi:thiamine-repressible mitochondrial transport protein THI74 [Stachybotrys elegans]|uniref:Thiamine-repressible mitochondrial transport protein THI74 n=1 Tax=Stachybotrys elegans TaxID=80388 RepID=A0A8K0WQQ6_9HYPO|nr:thiamine-repressible mitochondrial transport protein THI74 [Stachybotrys elegans]